MKIRFDQQASSGFFSDFNVIIGCLDYIINNNITEYSFVWNNNRYQNDTENLFNKYFFITKEYNSYDRIVSALSIGATYYQPFNKRKKFINSHNVLNHFNYFNNPIYKKLNDACVKADNCIGVHLRGTDHGQHGPLIDVEVYFKHIEEKIMSGGYKKIFLATDEAIYVDIFKQKYGEDRIITNDNIARSENKTPIHNGEFINKSKLITDVMLDAISLAHCKEIIITSSNVSAYTLAVNPFINYTFIDYLH